MREAPSKRNSSALTISARKYARSAHSENTLRAYGADWLSFSTWCQARGLEDLPATPKTIQLYLTHLADSGRRSSTIERALVTISQAHKDSGYQSPRLDAQVQRVRKGIRRNLGVASLQKSPMLPNALRAAFKTLPHTLQGQRDRALLALGLAGGFRRSELVALNVEDLLFTSDGVEVHIRRAKNDQEGAGRKLGIPTGGMKTTCPARLLQAWLRLGELTHGPLFRPLDRFGRVRPTRLTAQSVAIIVKRAAQAAGLKPKAFAGHSLRAGLVTAAAKAGKSTHAIMKQTGHKSPATVARYIRDLHLFEENAAEGIGL